MPTAEIVLVLTTVPDDGRAEMLAIMLIEERLAACVNIHAPIQSVYRWNGVVERGTERQLVIKTTRHRVPALGARLAEWHTYELPELLVVPVDGGGDAYLRWVREETGSSAAARPRARKRPARSTRRRSRS